MAGMCGERSSCIGKFLFLSHLHCSAEGEETRPGGCLLTPALPHFPLVSSPPVHVETSSPCQEWCALEGWGAPGHAEGRAVSGNHMGGCPGPAPAAAQPPGPPSHCLPPSFPVPKATPSTARAQLQSLDGEDHRVSGGAEEWSSCDRDTPGGTSTFRLSPVWWGGVGELRPTLAGSLVGRTHW